MEYYEGCCLGAYYEFTDEGKLIQSEHEAGTVNSTSYKYWIDNKKLKMNNGFMDVDLHVLKRDTESLVLKGPYMTLYFRK